MRLVLLVAALLAGCADRDAEPRDPAAGINFDYEVPLGDEFVRVPDLIAEDSRGDIWHAPGVEIATDFGEYGPMPACVGQPCQRLSIDGFPALLQRLRLNEGGARLHLAVSVYEPYDLSLVVVADCEVAARCEELTSALAATRIRILDQ